MKRHIDDLGCICFVLSFIMTVKSQSGFGSGFGSGGGSLIGSGSGIQGSGTLQRETPGCAARVDVIFVVQGSSSVGASNYELLRQTLVKMARYLALDSADGYSMAVIVYSSQTKLEIPFMSNRDLAIGLSEVLNYPNLSGVFLGDALLLMRAIFSSGRGNAIAKIGVVISSSISADTATIMANAMSARAEGIRMIAVSLGQSPSSTQIIQMDAIGDQGKLYYTSYREFYDKVNLLEDSICNTPGYCSVFGPSLVSDPRDCHKYLQCTGWPAPLPAYTVQPCPTGLFFNPAKVTCDFPIHVRCLTDPCHDTTYRSYPADQGCSSYWTCSDGRTTGHDCCNGGDAFVDGEGCDADPFCDDMCTEVPPPSKPIPPAVGCDRQGLRDVPDWYIELGELLSCPPGHVFDPPLCDCILASTTSGGYDLSVIRGDDCTPEVRLTFVSGVENSASATTSPWVNPGSVTVSQSGAGSVDGHYGEFNGQDDRLTVPFYTNTDWGGYLHVYLRLKESDNGTDGDNIEAIFSNSYCSGAYPSVELFLDRSTQEIVAYISTSEDFFIIRTFYMPGRWKDVTLRYDRANSLFLLDVDGDTVYSSPTTISGNIRTVNCGAALAHSLGRVYFQGYIDTASIYRGCLPTFPYTSSSLPVT